VKETVHLDCRHFRGDRPCAPHKAHGVLCRDCPYFSPWGERILIVKLDAPGDVLRSTCILPELKKAHPDSCIIWLTRPAALPLLEGNPFLDEVVGWDDGLALRLAVERFDLVLSLDSGHDGARAGSLAVAVQKRGFGCNADGKVVPLNAEAEEWFLMGVFDPLKKANRKSYPQILHEICRLPWSGARPVLHLTEAEKAFAARFVAERLTGRGPVIGLFTGAGRRWRGKAWSEAGFAGLIEQLLREETGQVLLLGGPDEAERNQRLLRQFPDRIVDGGCDNTLRQFAALVGLCDLLVTADTLALHVAAALAKKFAALVGPTSAAEIELYASGVIVEPDEECRCYYQPVCLHPPSCLERLPAEKVMQALRGLLP
jgi:heptosyltransferase-2